MTFAPHKLTSAPKPVHQICYYSLQFSSAIIWVGHIPVHQFQVENIFYQRFKNCQTHSHNLIDGHKKYVLNFISASFLTLYFSQCIIFVIDEKDCQILCKNSLIVRTSVHAPILTFISASFQHINTIRFVLNHHSQKLNQRTKMSKIIQAPEVKDEFLQCWLQCNNVNLNELQTRPGRNKVSSSGGERNFFSKKTETQGMDSI